jgi:signal transduction histidine kinase/ActR/RegA family two-component response regulator
MIEDDHLKRVAIHHPDPAFIARAREFEQRFPADRHSPAIHHVLETGASRLVPEITDAMLVANAANDEHLAALRRFGATSCLLVPLEAHDQRFGVLTLITSDTPRRLGKRDLRIAEDLAWRSAVAIDNARLYERLVEGDRRKDEFLATLAHELRNPLAPMRNALALLRSQGDEAPVRDNARTILERQLAQVVRLIDDLLDISRITRDKLVLRREPVTLASVIRDSIDTVRPTIDAAGHTLEVDLPDDPIPLDADRARLTQVFSNLLDNAAKYTEPGGRIGVFAQRKDGEVIVRVRDNGIGIPPEKLSRIFDLFVQVDASLERTHGGLGIGLTLAQRLVAMHGGSIEVSSEGPGKGTEFRVRLPVAAGATPPVRASKEPSEGKRPPLNRRILIADDVADSAESMALVLLMLGAEVRTARDGEQALEIAAQFRPQAALIDIGMPRLNGYQVAQRLRAEPWGKDMLLIALTGWGQEADRRASREAGFDHHVVKPVDIDALREILESEHVAAD